MMSKCWKWRPFSRPSFFDLIRMLDDALEGLKEHRYVNLADAVQGLNKMVCFHIKQRNFVLILTYR